MCKGDRRWGGDDENGGEDENWVLGGLKVVIIGADGDNGEKDERGDNHPKADASSLAACQTNEIKFRHSPGHDSHKDRPVLARASHLLLREGDKLLFAAKGAVPRARASGLGNHGRGRAIVGGRGVKVLVIECSRVSFRSNRWGEGGR